MALLRHRSSMRWLVSIVVGCLGTLLGAVLYIYSDHGPAIFLICASILLLLMQFVVPSLAFRRVYRRNRGMFGLRTVTISDAGIISDHELGRSETVWNTYQKFRETQSLLLPLSKPGPHRYLAQAWLP